MTVRAALELGRDRHGTSQLIEWLLGSTGSATATLSFLNRALHNVDVSRQRHVLTRLRGDAVQAEATLHELVLHETASLLGLRPEYEPRVGLLTPDLRIRAGDTAFLADVLVSSRPRATLFTQPGHPEMGGFADDGEARRKVAQAVEAKATKYAAASTPLIVFVSVGRERIGVQDIEQAYYGQTAGEIDESRIWPGDRWPNDRRGIIGSASEGFRHRHLAAVVACDWFDTLEQSAPGRRLHCVVLHHPDPVTPFPVTAFSPFEQIAWRRDGDRAWHAELYGIPGTVVNTAAGSSVKFAPYSSDAPW